jgi:uncharacterized protein
MELTGRVVDQADILSPATEVALVNQLSNLEQRSSDQLVVATTKSLNQDEIERYSLELARCWQIGNSSQNNGLMVLIAPNERKARIEVGRGLEDFVKDEEASAIMRKTIIPNFKNGDYDQGVEEGVAAIISELTSDSTAAAARFAASRLQGQKR